MPRAVLLSVRRARLSRDPGGFTLVELLVVIVVIAILLAIAVPSYAGFRDRAEEAAAKSALRIAVVPIESYVDDFGGYNHDSGGASELTLGYLKANYDAGLDTTDMGISNRTATSYCLSIRKNGKVWSKAGPGSDIVRGLNGCGSLTGAVSRKSHTSTGIPDDSYFDVALPLTGPSGVESRREWTGYQVVFFFAAPVTFNSASVTGGTGTVGSATGSGTNTIAVNLTGVATAQTITVTLLGVSDGTSTGDVGVPMGVLVGDVNGDRKVDSTDDTETRSRSGQLADATNFRFEVTANGAINSGDITVVRSNLGKVLP